MCGIVLGVECSDRCLRRDVCACKSHACISFASLCKGHSDSKILEEEEYVGVPSIGWVRG